MRREGGRAQAREVTKTLSENMGVGVADKTLDGCIEVIREHFLQALRKVKRSQEPSKIRFYFVLFYIIYIGPWLARLLVYQCSCWCLLRASQG